MSKILSWPSLGEGFRPANAIQGSSDLPAEGGGLVSDSQLHSHLGEQN
jgi:hypothetical protein